MVLKRRSGFSSCQEVSMLVYSFHIYEWPMSLLRKIVSYCRNFLWSGSFDKRGIPLVSWHQFCAPMAKGGLGLTQLVVLNRAFLLKKGWDALLSSSSDC